MTTHTRLTIREAKKLYKAALTSPTQAHRPDLVKRLTNRLTQAAAQDQCPLSQYRINQLKNKLNGMLLMAMQAPE